MRNWWATVSPAKQLLVIFGVSFAVYALAMALAG